MARTDNSFVVGSAADRRWRFIDSGGRLTFARVFGLIKSVIPLVENIKEVICPRLVQVVS